MQPAGWDHCPRSNDMLGSMVEVRPAGGLRAPRPQSTPPDVKRSDLSVWVVSSYSDLERFLALIA